MEQEFRDSIQKALHNPNLTGALGRFSEAYRISRAKAYEGIDFEAVRTRIAEIKSYAASHFDELADRFARNAEARGAIVFRTDDPQEVRDYVLQRSQGKRRQEHRQVQVDGVRGNPPQSSTSSKLESRSERLTWANGLFNWPGKRHRTW